MAAIALGAFAGAGYAGLHMLPPIVAAGEGSTAAAVRPASRRIGGPQRSIPAFSASERARRVAALPIQDELGASAPAKRPAVLPAPSEGGANEPSEAMIGFLETHEIKRGDAERGYVALTFDCGYGPDATRSILRSLARHGVRATFFLEGGFVRAYPELVVRIVAGGHELANHSATHPDFMKLDEDAIASELEETYELIEDALDEFGVLTRPLTHYFRFPFGARDKPRLHEVAKSGYQSVFWTLDPKGWQAESTSRAVVAHVDQRLKAGDIIIQHCNSWADAKAVPGIARIAQGRGLKLGTVSDVVRSSDLPDPSRLAPEEDEAAATVGPGGALGARIAIAATLSHRGGGTSPVAR